MRKTARLVLTTFGFRIGLPGRRDREQVSRTGNIGGAVAVGEEAVMPDAVKALRQDMREEPANELMRGQRHGLVSPRSLDPVILEFEGDAIGIGRDQPAVGDGDAVRLSCPDLCIRINQGYSMGPLVLMRQSWFGAAVARAKKMVTRTPSFGSEATSTRA
jgi:hypothetical protein